MLFAQATTEIPAYLNVVLQGGALAILAYHFLWGLPALFEKVNDNHRAIVDALFGEAAADRAGFEKRAAGIEAEIKQLREKAGCKYQP